ncbi:D-TA family PLP-dependent enzyme [Gordonia sp. SID5947]|uniref:alanine racemase n=1 Tax=Gordonia sp. SID5947 TaxID=2690315 RepID=UPI0013697DF7|nr:D-TA family PLP-dependent enzyme [Gordonia sp. SID5947]
MIDTPYLSLDVARLDRNIHGVAGHAQTAGLDLRPHAKTHKCAEIARRQLAAGAVGLTVATIGEAEAFATASPVRADLFIAYPLWVSGDKGRRLRALAAHTRLRLAVDSAEGARQLAAEIGHADVDVVVEVDSGQHRTGVVPQEAGGVASAAVDAGLRVIGVFTFPGHGYGPGDAPRRAAEQEVTALSVAAEQLRAVGVEPVVRSGGSTPTIEFAESGVLTEIRPGVYPLNDAQQIELGSCGFAEVALSAIATVVHRTGMRAVVDAGSKILGADRPPWTSGFGRVLDAPDATITSLSEHHAVIEFPSDTASTALPAPGDRLRVIPNHVCTAVNLVDELIAETPDGTTARWPVVARGANS